MFSVPSTDLPIRRFPWKSESSWNGSEVLALKFLSPLYSCNSWYARELMADDTPSIYEKTSLSRKVVNALCPILSRIASYCSIVEPKRLCVIPDDPLYYRLGEWLVFGELVIWRKCCWLCRALAPEALILNIWGSFVQTSVLRRADCKDYCILISSTSSLLPCSWFWSNGILL